MKKFKFIFLIFIFTVYLQAVLEVNTDTIENTWGDEYDSYIKTNNNVSFSHGPQSTYDDGTGKNFQPCPILRLQKSDLTVSAFFDTSPARLFIANSSLLI